MIPEKDIISYSSLTYLNLYQLPGVEKNPEFHVFSYFIHSESAHVASLDLHSVIIAIYLMHVQLAIAFKATVNINVTLWRH